MDVSELTPEQLEELHQALERDRLRLEEHLQLTKEGSKPVQLGTPMGRVSRMDAIQQQQMTKAGRLARHQAAAGPRLARSSCGRSASLEAYRKGDYGYSRSCHEPIGYPRLKARPEAPFCLNCQDTSES